MAITSAFQADDEGSIPSTCSKKELEIKFQVLFLFVFIIHINKLKKTEEYFHQVQKNAIMNAYI